MRTSELYASLLQPSSDLIADIRRLEGDIIILGIGGKMGPALGELAAEAVKRAGVNKRVIGVARFSDAPIRKHLEQKGVETIAGDLLDESTLTALPDVRNVLYLAGTKFGTTGKEPFTWAMNTYLPGRVAEKFPQSRIVIFSTGNVYPLTTIQSGGPDETIPPAPIGEYAQSCLGRERVFQYFSSKNNTPILIYRLNYANDVTYGVLVDIARSVWEGRPIDLKMGYVNVMWQGDANEMALRCLHHCSVPARTLNIAGPEIASVRKLAEEFGTRFSRKPAFVNAEQETALLSNAAESYRLFGKPKVSLQIMMNVIAAWISEGGKTLNKPTHFQERQGKF